MQLSEKSLVWRRAQTAWNHMIHHLFARSLRLRATFFFSPSVCDIFPAGKERKSSLERHLSSRPSRGNVILMKTEMFFPANCPHGESFGVLWMGNLRSRRCQLEDRFLLTRSSGRRVALLWGHDSAIAVDWKRRNEWPDSPFSVSKSPWIFAQRFNLQYEEINWFEFVESRSNYSNHHSACCCWVVRTKARCLWLQLWVQIGAENRSHAGPVMWTLMHKLDTIHAVLCATVAFGVCHKRPFCWDKDLVEEQDKVFVFTPLKSWIHPFAFAHCSVSFFPESKQKKIIGADGLILLLATTHNDWLCKYWLILRWSVHMEHIGDSWPFHRARGRCERLIVRSWKASKTTRRCVCLPHHGNLAMDTFAQNPLNLSLNWYNKTF